MSDLTPISSPDPSEAAQPQYLGGWGLAGLLGITLVAAGLRFTGLTDREIWLDESSTYYIVHHLFDWPAEGPNPIREVAHAPYVLSLACWVRLFGESTWGLRSFSALVGTLTVPILGTVGTRFGGRRLGLISAVLLAVNPLHVYYSQEARVYVLWIMLGLVTLYVLYQAITRLRAAWWLLYAIAIWALVLTHYYALLFIPATSVALFISTSRARAFRHWIIVHVLLAISFIPLLVFVPIPFSQTGPRFWLQTIWAGYPPGLAIPKSIGAMVLLGIYPRGYLGSLYWATEHLTRTLGAWAGYAVLCGPAILIVALIGCWAWRHRRNRHVPTADYFSNPGPGRLMVWLIGTTLAFLLTAWLASALIRPMYVVGRYDVVVLPALILALALLIDAAWGRGVAHVTAGKVVAVATIVFFIAGGTAISVKTRDDYRYAPNEQLTDRITQHVDEDDLVISTNLYRWFMAFEWDRRELAPEVISFPRAHDQQLGWDNPQAESRDPAQLDRDTLEIVERVRAARAAGRTAWILHHGDMEGLRGQIDLAFFRKLPLHGIGFDPVDPQAGLVRLVVEVPEKETETD